MLTSSRDSPDAGTSVAAADLPDINVWLALAVTEHAHHAAAMAYWLQNAAAKVCFCRVTMLGLVRLLTQPKVMGAAAMTLQSAMFAFDGWLALPGVHWAEEPAGCSAALRGLVAEGLPSRMWTDAYLAAFAQAAGLRLVSFDADFRRFNQLAQLQLRAPAPGTA